MLAPDYAYTQYSGNPARGRVREHMLCVCNCGWKGKYENLRPAEWRGDKNPLAMRRPEGFCPECGHRAFWMPLTEAQALVLK